MRCFSVWHSLSENKTVIARSKSIKFQCLAFPCVQGCPQGGRMRICHHLEIGTKNQKFLENLKSAA